MSSGVATEKSPGQLGASLPPEAKAWKDPFQNCVRNLEGLLRNSNGALESLTSKMTWHNDL
jgi:hypothetical protein